MSHKTKAEKIRTIERSVHQVQKKPIDTPIHVYSLSDLAKSILLTGLICSIIILLYVLRLRGILQ